MNAPWPSGEALLYRDDEYVSTITMPYTPNGTNASLVVGPSADLKVKKSLKDYNVTEAIREISSRDNRTSTVKETTKRSVYRLDLESNRDRPMLIEVTDSRPMESKLLNVSLEPSESTATSFKWRLTVPSRQKVAIEYTYLIVETQTLKDSKQQP